MGSGTRDIGDAFIDGDGVLVVEVMKGLVVIDADLAKGAEESLGGGDGEDDAGIERLHENAVADQIELRSPGQAKLVAAELRGAGGELKDAAVALSKQVGIVMGIGPALSVEDGEHGAAQADLTVAGGVAVDVNVGDDLGGLLDVSDFAEVDRFGEAGGDGVALGVAGEIASADARHGEEENGGGGQDGGNHDGGGAGQRTGEPLHRRDGAAAREQAGNGERRGVGGRRARNGATPWP